MKTHIAILRQPFYDLILSHKKTIESRWSNHKIAPYKQVEKGDTLLLKRTGQPVTATAKAGKVQFFELTPEIVDSIKERYGKEIGIDYFTNWETYRHKKYLTLIWLEEVEECAPMSVPNSNGAGWIVCK